jgi:hypothetical protein
MRFVVALLFATACLPPTIRYVGAPSYPRCNVRGALQDAACTPGDVETYDLDVVCKQSTKNRRDVSESVRRQVFEEYGIDYPPPKGAYEVDYLISLELGGSNSIKNLWPEAAEPKPGFHQKDNLENLLHRQVCRGEIKLEDAQERISKDWLTEYGRQFQ